MSGAPYDEFVSTWAVEFPFKVVTDKRGPKVSRLSAQVYGSVVFTSFQNGSYKLYLFQTQEYRARFERDYKNYIRKD